MDINIADIKRMCQTIKNSVHRAASYETVQRLPMLRKPPRQEISQSSGILTLPRATPGNRKRSVAPAAPVAPVAPAAPAAPVAHLLADITEFSGTATSPSSGILCIDIPGVCYPIPMVTATIAGGSGHVVIESVTITNFSVHTYDSSFTHAPYTFNWKVTAQTNPIPSGYVHTVAGSIQKGNADGQSLAAEFTMPIGVAFDSNGAIYVSDTGNNFIRKIDSANGMVTTLVTDLSLHSPHGIAVSPNNILYVADTGNNRICAIDLDEETIYSVPLMGIGLNLPKGVAVGIDGTLYIADTGNNAIHSIKGTTVRTYDRLFNRPHGIAVTSDGTLYVADTGNNLVRILRDGIVQSSIPCVSPTGIAVDIDGSIVVSETLHHRIMKIDPRSFDLTLLAGGSRGSRDGVGSSAQMNEPIGIAIHATGIAIADTGNTLIRVWLR